MLCVIVITVDPPWAVGPSIRTGALGGRHSAAAGVEVGVEEEGGEAQTGAQETCRQH